MQTIDSQEHSIQQNTMQGVSFRQEIGIGLASNMDHHDINDILASHVSGGSF